MTARTLLVLHDTSCSLILKAAPQLAEPTLEAALITGHYQVAASIVLFTPDQVPNILDFAFMLTNSISAPWASPENVEAILMDGVKVDHMHHAQVSLRPVTTSQRSTSVGDLIYDVDEKKLFYVDVIGFSEIKAKE